MTLHLERSLTSCRRDFAKVEDHLLDAPWWILSPILDAQTLLRFRQAKAWDEENWEAARSFCFLRLSSAALRLSVSSLLLCSSEVRAPKKNPCTARSWPKIGDMIHH